MLRFNGSICALNAQPFFSRYCLHSLSFDLRRKFATAISERSIGEHDNVLDTSSKSNQQPSFPSVDTKAGLPDVNQASRSYLNEVIGLSDEDDVPQRANRMITDRDNTMISSFTAGGDSDEIEIHQFSSADIDAYLDIYFEILNNRLRRYIGSDDELQRFRAATKDRINSNPNASEYRNVFLGKLGGEVVAAVTVLFPGETPTIPLTWEVPQQNSCLATIYSWLNQKGNYVPTNTTECYIEMIGVKNAFRNHGIGSAMLESAEYCAREAGAHVLTIHTNGQRLRNYFERSGFTIDHTDHSAIWKWIVERQSTHKLSKIVTLKEEILDHSRISYINLGMIESMDER